MPLMFLNGGGMRGGPLHGLLHGARLVDVVSTAPCYRFLSVQDRFPALEPVGTGGVSVEGELYELPLAVLAESLLPAEPEELELSVVELSDGRRALGMVLRRVASPATGVRDISAYRSWRAYQHDQHDQQGRCDQRPEPR